MYIYVHQDARVKSMHYIKKKKLKLIIINDFLNGSTNLVPFEMLKNSVTHKI